MSVLVCEKITKIRKKQPSIRNFSYNFLDNQIYAVVGKSDSGKELLLEILSARTKADSGNIYLDGEPFPNNRKMSGRLCYLANDSEFPGHLRVKTICRIMESFYPKWDNGYAYELLDFFKFDPGKMFKNLEKNQKQLLIGILGLASRANVTVLNNPLDSVDIKDRFEYFNFLYDHHLRYPRTVIISTNHIDELESIAGRILFLDKGILFEDCTGEEIRDTFRYLSGKSEVLRSLVSNIKIIGYEERDNYLTVCVPRRLSKDETRKFQRYLINISEVPAHKVFIYLVNLRELKGI